MPSAADVIRLARAELGKTRGAEYFADLGYGDLGDWCIAFLRAMYHRAGVEFPWYSFCAWDERDVPREHRVGRESLKAGDAAAWDWDVDGKGDHGSIVVSVHDWGCVTVGGNEGRPAMVREQQRTWDNFICGIRPLWGDSPSGVTLLDVDGWAGKLTITHWQRQMGLTDDGVLSGQLPEEDVWRRNVLSYDRLGAGSALVYSVQWRLAGAGMYQGLLDGCWGYGTSCALQRQLRAWGYYSLDIDGLFGMGSVKALQESINDGRWKG